MTKTSESSFFSRDLLLQFSTFHVYEPASASGVGTTTSAPAAGSGGAASTAGAPGRREGTLRSRKRARRRRTVLAVRLHRLLHRGGRSPSPPDAAP